MALLREECFSKSWNVKPLGEVVDFLDNLRRPVKSEDRVEGEYNYYGANGLQGTINDFLFDEPLILLAEDGGHFGNPERDIAYIAKGKYWVNNHAHVLKPKAGLDLDFLYRVLQKYDVTKFIKGATRAKLTKGDAAMMPIPLPPLEEQKRIAAILDKADAIRRKRQQAIKLADEFLRSVFLDMFGDPVTNPKEWEVRSIDEVCLTIVDCVNKTAPTVKYQTPYKMIRTTNVRNYSLDTKNVRYVNEDTYKNWIRRLEPQVGDLIFTREAPAGEAAIVSIEENIFLGQRTMHFRPDQKLISSGFLMFELMGSGVKRQINKMHAGSTVTHLSVPECKKFKIRVPPLDIQKRFELIRHSTLKLIAAGEVATTTPVFESLSQKAFSGEL